MGFLITSPLVSEACAGKQMYLCANVCLTLSTPKGMEEIESTAIPSLLFSSFF
jgi:hypothetical protein